MSNLSALAERLEKATGEVDEALDLDLARVLAPNVICQRMKRWPSEVIEDFVHWRYTSSLDAAVALCERVLEGCHWSVTNAATKPRANVWMPEVIRPIMGPYSSAPTPALALCLAIVRAKLAEAE